MNAPAPRLRLGAWRLLAVTLAGPLVGALVYVVVSLLAQLPQVTFEDVVEMGGFMLVVGWMLGLVPAAVSALVVRFLGLAADAPRRLVEAMAIGALSAVVALPIILPVLFGLTMPPIEVVLLFGLCGAVAFCATALPGLRVG
ncbi:hypothetical protein FF80_02862 [Devosia sp. LC5]|uniref:hypothetical protein n=1 Tax=Devosia sp. LC5 TaxID=1502724 RepID=UPI0004E3D7EE|nr:hypothetical protein [Devosia sp. LC5]KFC65105.1 hypothetical protein FF80_02862 [Devosia sp. LC5]